MLSSSVCSLSPGRRRAGEAPLAKEVGHEELLALGLGLPDAHDGSKLDIVGQGATVGGGDALAAGVAGAGGHRGDVPIVHVVVARTQLLKAVVR